ncbi:MAG: nuclear transport factor 2 family protein, partial [Pseudomonadota bacterium]
MNALKPFALALMLAAPAAAQPGDPVTTETAADMAEMTRIADAIDAAVDAKDWALARSFFADT